MYSDVDMNQLVSLTDGYSGADLKVFLLLWEEGVWVIDGSADLVSRCVDDAYPTADGFHGPCSHQGTVRFRPAVQ